MANNRLYIRDRSTGRTFYLARSNDPGGWNLACTLVELQAWLDGWTLDDDGKRVLSDAIVDHRACDDDEDHTTQLVLLCDKMKAAADDPTERIEHDCDCESTEKRRGNELAPRSGALEPEETTGGPGRKGV